MGLRELKKQQTRERICETAWRLFAERGFDQVTVAEVAREAEVALATVFNYFPSKEELFYGRLEKRTTQLVEAVAGRDAGESVLVAYRRYLNSSEGLLSRVAAGDSDALERIRTLNRVIAGSPALQARERLIFSRTAGALADLLMAADPTPADEVSAHAVANALTGVQQALMDYARRRVLADDNVVGLARDLRKASDAAFATLERGLDNVGS
ncbi:TetR family transcriptional regulator [Actinopolymorpha alba]|uniref:TetR family transcriptional regulator n=1 Tax=Actinopolymorpha alba TaxID=533267 RepID=UPI00036E526D|nr:TetR family transcriptional regulator [Actinopolymorpha alba]